LINPEGFGMIVIPASLRSDFIHIAGMPIHIPLESTIHIAGIRTLAREERQSDSGLGLSELKGQACRSAERHRSDDCADA
jgi:hypothetical protein